MDPNAALSFIRELATEALNSGDDSLAFKALERFEELDEWLSRGGFLPTSWAENRTCDD
jgi:hypothetical protein